MFNVDMAKCPNCGRSVEHSDYYPYCSRRCCREDGKYPESLKAKNDAKKRQDTFFSGCITFIYIIIGLIIGIPFLLLAIASLM